MEIRKKLIYFVALGLFGASTAFFYLKLHPTPDIPELNLPKWAEYRQKERKSTADKILCIILPDPTHSFNSITSESLELVNPDLRYTKNSQNLSVVLDSDGISHLRQRFKPSPKGSERVIISTNLPDSDAYDLEQYVFIEPGFQWGGAIESGKFGYGFAGGSAPTGGSSDTDGFSSRFMWKGRNDGTAVLGIYIYSADRSQNLPYGDELLIEDFTIPVGKWFHLKMALKTNSDVFNQDGALQVWANDDLLLDKQGIQWQSSGKKPMIDQVLYSTFHGGNTEEWSPKSEVYAQFSNSCVFKEHNTNQALSTQ